jgi:hypothetical protein
MTTETKTLFIKDSFVSCEHCAYHESGHILFAYLAGYSCLHVELLSYQPQKDYSSIALIDYGKDVSLVNRFLSPDTKPQFFQHLPLVQQEQSIEIAQRLLRIYIGGSVAVSVFNNKGNPYVSLPIQMDYTDLLPVEHIEACLQQMDAREEGLVEHLLQDVLYTISNINIWQTISDLAQRLMHQRELYRNDIEECLDEHGISYNKPLVSSDHHPII